MLKLHELFTAHDRAVQGLQLFKRVCDTEPELRRTLNLTLRGNTYRITYTPRRQLGLWDRILACLGMERRIAVQRVRPDRTVLTAFRCHATVPSESGWIRAVAKLLLREKLEHPAVVALDDSQRRYARLRTATEMHANCDVGAGEIGSQRQAVLYGAKPTLEQHRWAFEQARAPLIEPPPWERLRANQAPCYEIRVVSDAGSTPYAPAQTESVKPDNAVLKAAPEPVSIAVQAR